jgi:4-amino-4-deoxy-L-arabinose transferase-like glycosyltransferase
MDYIILFVLSALYSVMAYSTVKEVALAMSVCTVLSMCIYYLWVRRSYKTRITMITVASVLNVGLVAETKMPGSVFDVITAVCFLLSVYVVYLCALSLDYEHA